MTPLAPPGVSRPGLRVAAAAATRHAIRSAVRRTGLPVHAVVAASLDDVLGACPGALRVLWGTDDWVAGAELMGLSADYLRRREDAQLASAELVVTVTGYLADRWRERSARVAVVPNGCDPGHFAHVDDAPPAPDVHLPGPVAGFVGHLSDRIDVGVLEAVADTGASLLLVGPVQPGFATDRLARLVARENVQATGRRPFEELPGYLRRIDVGLTPYADTAFNRASFPLKTLEYLAAGRPVVTTGLPAARSSPQTWSRSPTVPRRWPQPRSRRCPRPRPRAGRPSSRVRGGAELGRAGAGVPRRPRPQRARPGDRSPAALNRTPCGSDAPVRPADVVQLPQRRTPVPDER
ncbi:glycosyltransferase [Cellulomonas soli]